MSEEKFRHELKHYINYLDYLELASRLKIIARCDENSLTNGCYKVRSLYFDNYSDKALSEKLNGISNREKFRLRYYNANPTFIRLEKKSKINGLCKKQNSLISQKECHSLLSGDINFLKASQNSLFLELYAKMHYQCLRPKNIVDYTREAYIYPVGNVRVTIDREIRTSGNILGFLNPELASRLVSQAIILELKYDEFLPQIISAMLQLKNRQHTAFSKYASARIS